MEESKFDVSQMSKEEKYETPTTSPYRDLETGEGTSGTETDNDRAYSNVNTVTAAERALELEAAASLNAPKDHFFLVAIILVIQGIGVLFPWNTVLTITTYFNWKMKGSQYESSYNNYFNFVYSACDVIAATFFSTVQHRISMLNRVMIPLIIQFLVYAVFLILIYIDTAIEGVFFGIMMALIIILGINCGFNEPGIYSIASFLPSTYQKFPVQGEAWAGVIVAAINVITLAGSTSIKSAACAFFAVSLFVIGTCIATYPYLISNDFFHYWKKFYISVEGEMRAAQNAEMGIEAQTEQASISWPEYFSIFRRVGDMAFTTWWNFTITLLVFPILPLSVTPYTHDGSQFFGALWVPIYTFLFFDIFDLTGRFIAQFLIAPRKWVPWISIARVIFFPLFVFCHNTCLDDATGLYVDSYIPVAFTNDAAPIIFIIVFALTNGYVFNCVMYHTPNIVKGHERPTACAIVISTLSFGILCGSLTSFGARTVICPGSVS